MERAVSLVSALTVEQIEGGNAGRGEAAERHYVAGSTFRRPQVPVGPQVYQIKTRPFGLGCVSPGRTLPTCPWPLTLQIRKAPTALFYYFSWNAPGRLLGNEACHIISSSGDVPDPAEH